MVFLCKVQTLAARGLGELFLLLCCCVSFLVVVGNSFRCYLPSIPVVPLSPFLVAAGNSFWLHRSVFWLWREIVFGVTYLPTIPVVPLCQFFGCGGKHFDLRKILIGFLCFKKTTRQPRGQRKIAIVHFFPQLYNLFCSCAMYFAVVLFV